MSNHLLSIVFLFISYSSLLAQTDFSESSFQEAVGLAEQKDKLVYVFAVTSWCVPCDEMEATVFSDSSVSDVLNQNFIPLKQNIETPFGSKFAMKYRIKRAPEHLFFNSKGRLIRRFSGKLDSDSFLDLANLTLDSAAVYKPLEDPMNFDLDFPEWYIDFRNPTDERIFPSDSQIKSFLASRDSITDEVSWAVIYTLPTPEEYTGKIIESKEILSERYGRDEVLEELSSFVYQDVKKAIKNQSESMLYESMRKANRLLGDDAELYKIRYQLYYYQMSGNWNLYADLGSELARNTDLRNDDWLNDIAINLYQNTTNTEALTKATNWMKQVIDSNPTYPYQSTAAMIEYQLQNKERALELAKEAIKSAENSGEDSTEMKNLISRIEE